MVLILILNIFVFIFEVIIFNFVFLRYFLNYRERDCSSFGLGDYIWCFRELGDLVYKVLLFRGWIEWVF